MFERLHEVASAWREILHVSEWTGLSVGALAGLAALFYFVPIARKLAVLLAINVLIAYICLLAGNAVGTGDTKKEWQAERDAAAAAQQKREADIAHQLEDTYQPQLAELKQLSDARKEKADAYERQISDLSKKSPAVRSACELGDAARRPAGRVRGP